MTDPKLRADLEVAEGSSLKSYKDSRGLWTIGIGHLIQPQPPSDPGLVWTQEKVDAQLDEDLESAVTFAKGTPEWGFLDTPCRQNAVIELCFNLRKKWLWFVNARIAIRAKDWQTAHNELLNSTWASQVHAVRAERIANYLLTGEYNGP
jgi:GH24 family phage-related lysozyme (muramidase)